MTVVLLMGLDIGASEMSSTVGKVPGDSGDVYNDGGSLIKEMVITVGKSS